METEPGGRLAGDRERLVILGCGFAGYALCARLPRRLFDVTIVSPRNYFLFTPLLPSAVSGTVELRSILEPIRRRLRHVRLLEAEASGVDWRRRRVECRGAVSGEAFPLEFDLLAVAVGAAAADYGIPGVAERAVSLASVEDAARIRRRLLEQFARAEVPGLPAAEIDRRLSFVICGGGPTGVEVAAEFHDLLARELRWLYPGLVGRARVVLLEATDRLLTGFDQALASYAASHFLREGVEVRTSAPVVEVGPESVRLEDGGEVPAGLVVWAAGNAPRALLPGLGLPMTGGRLVVDDRLRLAAAATEAYALGDCAAFGDPPLPATAQVAQAQGRYLARALARGRRGRPIRPFTYRSLGMLAYLGGGKALADLPSVKWSGRAAWYFWKSVYLTRLVSLANRVKVLFDWVKASLLGRDLSRF